MTLSNLQRQKSVCQILLGKKIEILKFFNMNFDGTEINFPVKLYVLCKFRLVNMDVEMILLFLFKFDANRVSLFSFKEHAFADRVATPLLVYKNNP